jgi:hypothetical protein
VRAILDERLEVSDMFEEDITNRIDDGAVFLPFGECIAETGVDGNDFKDVPEDLRDEVGSAGLGYDVASLKRLDPLLNGCQ